MGDFANLFRRLRFRSRCRSFARCHTTPGFMKLAGSASEVVASNFSLTARRGRHTSDWAIGRPRIQRRKVEQPPAICEGSQLSPRRTWCLLQRLSDLFNADFLLCYWIDSNASFPRLTAASTRFGSAVQTKGFGVELVSARKGLMAAWRSTRERKTPRLRRRLVSLAKKPSTALSQDAEGRGEVERPAGMSRKPSAPYYGADATGALKVPRAFGVLVGHLPSAILSLPAFVSRSPPDNSCMYPSWISRSLCSAGIVRCIKPLAQSRNETNSSWVNGADKSGFIFQICASGAAVQASHPATIKLTHYRAFRLDV